MFIIQITKFYLLQQIVHPSKAGTFTVCVALVNDSSLQISETVDQILS